MEMIRQIRDKVTNCAESELHVAIRDIHRNQEILERYKAGGADVFELLGAFQSASVLESRLFRYTPSTELFNKGSFTDRASLNSIVLFSCKNIKESEEDFV